MIAPESLPLALKTLHRLIVYARAKAYDGDAEGAANFLDGFELLPEYLADDTDRTEEILLSLQGMAQSNPECDSLALEFERAVVPRTPITQEQWRAFVLATADSITDPTFERPPQGDVQGREPLP